ncbi:hypothetical protein [Jiangella gansuensis]|uniref:hypothetical protein n=1 Tax=Jiangella gansuensis TaxID=281473 RepID=UPI0012FBE964|nr:hypothetical protein [Jiangella gansuensis]
MVLGDWVWDMASNNRHVPKPVGGWVGAAAGAERASTHRNTQSNAKDGDAFVSVRQRAQVA